MEELPLATAEGQPSHLAFRLDRLPGDGMAGRTLLYLHGFGSTQAGEKSAFFRQAALAAGWCFASFDFQGHGASGGEIGRLTLSRNLADLERVVRELGARGQGPLVLVGSSMGGLTGLWFAATNPHLVAAGLYVAPAVDLGSRTERRLGPEGLARWQRDGALSVETELVRCDMHWDFVADLRRYPTAELARRHATPSLVFQGQRDDSVDWREVAAFAGEAVAGTVELHLFPEGDHRLLAQKPEIWARSLEFLSRKLEP